jgi:hypothetical protein
MIQNKPMYQNKELPLFNPFSFHVDPMNRLLLVNFEKDPDEIYIGLEPQYFDDPINGKGLLVIAWRRDKKIDVYHESSLSPDPSKFDIAGDGLHTIQNVDFHKNNFEIHEKGVSVDISFNDKLGRKIEILIKESHTKDREPFGLLAPMGDAAKNPSAMPLILLHDFYFVRKNRTNCQVRINGNIHLIDKMPFPMDGMWMYFARYSPDPFIVTFNPAVIGHLLSSHHDPNEIIVENVKNAKELRKVIKRSDGHSIELSFEPAFPQFNLLNDGAVVKGRFTIFSSESTGKIIGEYLVAKKENEALIRMIPSDGWQPKAGKFTLKLLYTIAKIFKNWPKSYLWSAKLTWSDGQWKMDSHWSRINSRLSIADGINIEY